MGEVHAVTVYHAHDNKIDKLAEITTSDSIRHPLFYSHAAPSASISTPTNIKSSGLADCGNPARYHHFFEQAVELLDDGLIRIPLLRLNNERLDRETYGATRAATSKNTSSRLAFLDSDTNDDHRDVAAALQECLDKVMLHICGHFGRKTGLRKLAMAGGVALNCTANGRLLSVWSVRRHLRSAGRGRRRLRPWRRALVGIAQRRRKKRGIAGSLPRPRALASRNRQGSR